MPDPILILGASVRAAAFSALRGGLAPYGIDMFADLDLRHRCQVSIAENYPHDLVNIARLAPAAPWMYTGALENHPDTIAAISADRELLGVGGGALARARNPFELGRSLSRAGIAYPEIRRLPEGLSTDGRWLRKRARSAGGYQVSSWRGEAREGARPVRDEYFQEFIAGTPCAAVFLAAGGAAQLRGVTEQILRRSSPEERPFRYAGSLGPLTVSRSMDAALQKIGSVLAAEFGTRGIFGVDFVSRDDSPVVIEVNPRYTASCEILEWFSGESLVQSHVETCQNGRLDAPARPSSISMTSAWRGKKVLFAPDDLIVSRDFSERLLSEVSASDWPSAADIPAAGVQLRAGQPVATAFAVDESREATTRALDDRLAEWTRLLLEAKVPQEP